VSKKAHSVTNKIEIANCQLKVAILKQRTVL